MTMAFTGPVVLPTPAELEAHPKHLGVVAFFDGYRQGQGGARPVDRHTYPRPLTLCEWDCWQDGWLEARADLAEWNARITTAAEHGPLEPAGGF